jgi:hypothetical protein
MVLRAYLLYLMLLKYRKRMWERPVELACGWNLLNVLTEVMSLRSCHLHFESSLQCL